MELCDKDAIPSWTHGVYLLLYPASHQFYGRRAPPGVGAALVLSFPVPLAGGPWGILIPQGPFFKNLIKCGVQVSLFRTSWSLQGQLQLELFTHAFYSVSLGLHPPTS